MKVYTEVYIDPFPIRVEHNNSILTIGSCFAENVGKYFERLKFDSLINPFGVLYNTASIYNSVKLVSDKIIFTEDDLVFDQEEWHSFYHHSDFSHHKVETVLSNINSVSASLHDFLQRTDWMIISLGASFVYRHSERNIIVSNCHKISQKEFNREFLSAEENFANIKKIITTQRSINENTKFILTVSPIRHLKDGAQKNQLSKASLLLAAAKAEEEFENVFYFPSYEIVMDELRDYRFYERDLVHPNEIAIDYIWEKFSENVLSNNCKELITQITKVVNAAQHRIRNIYSAKSKDFAANQIKFIEKLKAKHSYLDFENDLNKFRSILDS